MAQSLLGLRPPDPLVIDITSTSMNIVWEKWIENLEMYFIAAGITDPERQKALLLYLGGEELRKIYNTLGDNKETFTDAKLLLDAHFKPKLNVTFERNKFYQALLEDNEKISSYVVRLKELSRTCEFDYYTSEDAIVDQVIKCTSNKLRRRFLREESLQLHDLLKIAHAIESSEEQASEMERNEERLYNLRISGTDNVDEGIVHQVNNGSKGSSNKKKKCCGCGSNNHLYKSEQCKALNKHCSFCSGPHHFADQCFVKKRKEEEQKKEKKNYDHGNKGVPGKLNTLNIQDSDSDDEYLLALNNSSKRTDVILKLDSYKVGFMIDSGATINIIDKNTFNSLSQDRDIELHKSATKLYVYGSSKPMEHLGYFISNVSYKNQHEIVKIYVSSTCDSGCILSRSTAVLFGMLKIEIDTINNINTLDEPSTRKNLEKIVQSYDNIFHGLGKLRNVQIKFNIDENVKPIIQHQRRIPYHTRKEVDAKLDELLEYGVIEPVTGPTPWVSPLVAVQEKNKTRIVLDSRLPNTAIKRTHHPIPTLDDLLEKFNGCKVFSKLDLRHGYHQIELEPDSRIITAFQCHKVSH